MKEYKTAADLPFEWNDDIGDNLYLSKEFLSFMEGKTNIKNQRYFLSSNKNSPDAKFLLFTIPKYPIAQFASSALKIDASFIYLPLSVSKPGIVFGHNQQQTLQFIKKMPGLKLILNLPKSITSKGFAQIETCPRCVLSLRWSSFNDYFTSLRSNYRNRYKKCLARSGHLTLCSLEDNKLFSDDMYSLYLQVYNNARYKIEKLEHDFFKGSFFKTLLLKDISGKILAFMQLLENGEELIFDFIGFDASANKSYDIYQRALLEIVRYGINGGFKRIDFGQTAEDAKLKLGCKYERIFVLANHSNCFLNFLLKLTSKLLNYRPPASDTKFNVFNKAP